MTNNNEPVGELLPGNACKGIGFYALATTIGYVVVTAFLHGFSAYVLTLTMFASSVLFYLTGPIDSQRLRVWSKALTWPTLRLAVCSLVYWYAFWVGYTASDSTLALAFLAVTVFTTPFFVKFYRNKLTSRWLRSTALFAVLFLLGIALIKSKFDLGDSFQSAITPDLLFAGLCMLIAVLAEAAAEVTRISIVHAVRQNRIVLEDKCLISDKTPAEQAASQANVSSQAVCAIVALAIFALLHKWTLPQLSTNSLLFASWFGFWLLCLGFVGNIARQACVDPLTTGYDLASDTIYPWLGLRPLAFYVLAFLFITSAKATGKCSSNRCQLSDAGDIVINIGFLPESYHSYWLGVALITVVSLKKIFEYVQHGFTNKAIEEREKREEEEGRGA